MSKVSRGELVALTVLYILPATLLWINIFPYHYRARLVLVLLLSVLAFCIWKRMSWEELGLGTKYLKKAIFWNGVLSAFFLLILVVSYNMGWIREPTIPDWNKFFFFYVFISSPVQEFLFRGVAFAALKRNGVHHAMPLISITAINYCYLHVFYNDWITLAVTLFMGFIWGVIYYKYPNVWGTAFSHAVLGAVSIFVGLV